MSLAALLGSILLPAVLCGVWLVAAELARRRSAGAQQDWGSPVGLAIAYGLGDAFVRGAPPFPPIEATQWLPFLALVAGAVGLLVALSPLPEWARLALSASVLATVVGLVLRPLWQNTWAPRESVVRLTVLVALALALSIGTDRTLRRLSPVAGWGVLVAVTAGVAVALGASGSLLLAQLAGVLSSATGGGFVVALARRRPITGTGGIVVVSLLSGLLLAGAFYSALPRTSAVLFAAAPVAAALVPARSKWLIPVGVVLVLVVAAVAIAVTAGAPSGYYAR